MSSCRISGGRRCLTSDGIRVAGCTLPGWQFRPVAIPPRDRQGDPHSLALCVQGPPVAGSCGLGSFRSRPGGRILPGEEAGRTDPLGCRGSHRSAGADSFVPAGAEVPHEPLPAAPAARRGVRRAGGCAATIHARRCASGRQPDRAVLTMSTGKGVTSGNSTDLRGLASLAVDAAPPAARDRGGITPGRFPENVRP